MLMTLSLTPSTSVTPPESPVPVVPVLAEDDAVELPAYLVTAARTQLAEASEYAPMRLLTAAGRLAANRRLPRSRGRCARS
ncbi:hypothetical protein GCM10023335_55160 [Streptomyces siamensis]|uniref:Uncharacterized protein n=2 Tax=Streptomyces siamensis TaxID=1274986 RepID=A0ABP9J7G4_9ACTN